MTTARKKTAPGQSARFEDPKGYPQEHPVQITPAPGCVAVHGWHGASEPFPGRALAIRAAKTDADLARACVRYAAARMMVRAMRGQAPDNACEVVAGSVAEHVRHCAVLPKPSRRQMARAVETAFAFAERGA